MVKRAAGTSTLSRPSRQRLGARRDGPQPLYNEPITIHYRGAFDLKAFELSFNEILRRHEIWRTSFDIRWGGQADRARRSAFDWT